MNKKVILPIVMGAYICCVPISAKATNYKKWDMKVTGNKDKVWKVKFSKTLDKDIKDIEDKIYIKDSKGNKLECKVNVKDNGKSLEIIPPKEGYELTESYYLYIDKSITSKRKEKLTETIKMDFYLDKKVEFKDKNLEKIIRKELKKPSGDILINDISTAKIRYLDCSNADIKSLEGLEHLTDIKNLKLNDNKIDDLTPIKDLTSLNILDISNNNIKKIEPLKNLNDINVLHLKGNKIEDYKAIESYYYKIKDKDFSLYENFKIYFEDKTLEEEVRKAAIESGNPKDRPVGDLYNMTYTDVIGIKKLNLHNKYIKSLKGLEYLRGLEELNLSHNEVEDISTLKELSNLKRLDLSDNRIDHIGALSDLENLQYLNLSRNIIEDISPLKKLKKLNYLELRDNYIYYIDVLKDKNTLEHLFIANNNIIDFTPLSYLNKLKDLYLINNISSNYEHTKYYYGNLLGKDFNLNIPINFADKDFEALIRKEIKKPEGIIYTNDVKDIKKLYLHNAHIHNIHGIENLKSLESLDLSGTDIKDISSLEGLANLKEVNLENVNINDISSLKNCSDLRSLNINNTKVTTLEPIKNMICLENLYLSSTKVKSIEPLLSLIKLKDLDISNNSIEFNNKNTKNIIKNLANLSKLNISNNNTIDNCDFLTSLNNLVYLNISNTKISVINCLNNLLNIEYLNVSNTKVTDLQVIRNLLKLRKLDITGCNIDGKINGDILNHNNSLEIVGNEIVTFPDKNLENEIRNIIGKHSGTIYERELLGINKLELNNKEISNIQGLEHLRNLIYLDLSNNNITEIKPLEIFSNNNSNGGLKKLILHNNKIQDVSSLENIFSLEELDLSDNDIGDIKYLSKLINLQRLDLSKNEIVDIDSLKGLRNLKYLSLYDNKIQNNEEALRKLFNLTELYLKNSGVTNYTVTGAFYNQLVKKDFMCPSDFIVFKGDDKTSLAKEIRVKLGKLENTNVFKSDVDKITEINLSNRGIEDLEGIQYLSNLTSLKMRIDQTDKTPNKITNIENLAALKKLILLDLGGCKDINNLECIKYLKELQYLYLDNIDIENNNINRKNQLNFIPYLTNLKELDLSKNNLTNIKYLYNLKELDKLYLGKNLITDISPLEDLINLSTLDLMDNGNGKYVLKNIEPLKSLVNLKYLTLPKSVTDFTPTIKYYYNLIYKNFELNSNNIITLQEVKDIEKEINEKENFKLPNFVEGIMSDKSKESFKVIWGNNEKIKENNIVDTLKEGVYHFTGSVDGYGKKVKLTLIIKGQVPSYNGNSSGNIINGGFMAQDDNYIYYVNKDGENRIYKNRINGAEDTRISLNSAEFLNVYKDYIYYVNGGNIYRIKKDGTEEEKVHSCDASYMIICKEWIFYFDKIKGGIYKIKVDGTGYAPVIVDGKWRVDSKFTVDDEYVYYQNYNDNLNIYKVRHDGLGNVKVNNIKTETMIISGRYVYYISNGNIYKMNKDGSDNTLIYSGNVANINVNDVDSTIYFINNDDNGTLYKINAQGTGENKLTKEPVKNISIIGQQVYH